MGSCHWAYMYQAWKSKRLTVLEGSSRGHILESSRKDYAAIIFPKLFQEMILSNSVSCASFAHGTLSVMNHLRMRWASHILLWEKVCQKVWVMLRSIHTLLQFLLFWLSSTLKTPPVGFLHLTYYWFGSPKSY